jgi:hypothetical protein
VRIHGLQPGHVDVRLLIDEAVNSVRALPLCARSRQAMGGVASARPGAGPTQSASACPTRSRVDPNLLHIVRGRAAYHDVNKPSLRCMQSHPAVCRGGVTADAVVEVAATFGPETADR